MEIAIGMKILSKNIKNLELENEKLAKELDITTPENIHIIAVEIIEDMIFSDEFTPLLQEKYPEILKEVTEMVEGLLKK